MWLELATLGSGLLQGLTGSRSEARKRALERQRMAEERRQFDLRQGLDSRRVGLEEGQDRRRSSALAATAGNRQALIASLLSRLGLGGR